MKAAALVLMLTTAGALAQWSTNWPSYQFPRQAKSQLDQCWTATVERCWAQTTSDGHNEVGTPTAPTWYRSARANVIELKTRVRAIFSGNTSKQIVNTAAIGGGSVIDWIVANTSSHAVTNAPVFTNAESFLEFIYRPTNYFDYTPYTALSELGPYTNDATVGHAHGWTNEYTLSGGTNFPSGRSAWYTTDYGIDGLRQILTNITVFAVKEVPRFIGLFGYTYTTFGAADYSAGDDWADAVAMAEGRWLPDPVQDSRDACVATWGSKGVSASDTNWTASIEGSGGPRYRSGVHDLTTIRTNLTAQNYFIFISTNVTLLSLGQSSSNSTYDDYGAGVASGKNIKTGEWNNAMTSRPQLKAASFDNFIPMSVITNLPSPFCAEPADNNDIIRGWKNATNSMIYIVPNFAF